MKAFVSGVEAAILLATFAAVVLETKVQRSSETAFSTQGTRL